MPVFAETNAWRTCITGINYDSPTGSEDEIRVLDKFGRDITNAGISLIDWEGFVKNPQFRFSIVPPSNTLDPLSFRVTVPGGPRLYLFNKHLGGNDPYDIYHRLSMHNEHGPAWGFQLKTVNGGEEVFGGEGIAHDMSDAQLLEIGLGRQVYTYNEFDFPLELRLGIHGDREAGDESYTLVIEMTDGNLNVHEQQIPVHVCDQDRPGRPVEFKFHIDYSTDWDNYLEGTEDGRVIKEGYERILNDIAYFYQDMRFDEVPTGGCETFVNWTQADHPGTATNSFAYDRGYYIFINSHSGGGGLSTTYNDQHTREGVATDFPACGFWGANHRDELVSNVNTRLYAPEDDWWRTNHKLYGRDGQCLGDELDDPGQSCIECPNDEEWCVHERGDIYWPNLHELHHGLAMGKGWPRWTAWAQSEDGCVDDEGLMTFLGTCVPMYSTDHMVTLGLNSATEHGEGLGRNPFSRFDYYLLRAVGWEMRETTMMVPLTIITTSLSVATVGQAYQDTVEVKGGIPGYRFSVFDGSLPPGLDLNMFTGELTGTPTTPGTYSFTIRALDSEEYNVLHAGGFNKTYRLTVRD